MGIVTKQKNILLSSSKLVAMLFLGTYFLGLSVAIASQATQNPKIQSTKIKPAESNFTGSINVARVGSLVDNQDGTKTDSVDSTLSLSYLFAEKYKLNSTFYYNQNLNTDKGDWDDLDLSLVKKPTPLFSRLLFAPGILGVVPMAKNSYIRKEYLGGVGAVAKFSFEPRTFVGGLDFKFSFSLIKNAFKYETTIDGKPNSEYSSIQKFVASHAYKNLTTSLIFLHLNNVSFQNELRESFLHFEEIGYNFNSRFSVAIGHANTGSALKPNGQDTNILLINENSSVVYASTTLNF